MKIEQRVAKFWHIRNVRELWIYYQLSGDGYHRLVATLEILEKQ